MAQATRLPRQVVEFTGVELTLSEDEAATLLKVSQNIGGSGPRRAHMQSIGDTLRLAGYKRDKKIVCTGNIYF